MRSEIVEQQPGFGGESAEPGGSLMMVERQTLAVARLLVLALLMAASLFLLVIVMRVQQGAAAAPAGGAAGGASGGGALTLSTVVILQLIWSSCMLISVLGYPIFRQPAIRPLLTMRADRNDERDRQMIARGYLMVTLVGAGLAEGLSMLGTVIVMSSGRMFNVLLGAAPLLAFLLLMPTAGRMIRFRESIYQRRMQSLGP